MSESQKHKSSETSAKKQTPRQASRVGQGSVAQHEEPDLLALQRTLTNPAMAAPADILALGRSYGNTAVQRVLTQSNIGRQADPNKDGRVKALRSEGQKDVIQRNNGEDGFFKKIGKGIKNFFKQETTMWNKLARVAGIAGAWLPPPFGGIAGTISQIADQRHELGQSRESRKKDQQHDEQIEELRTDIAEIRFSFEKNKMAVAPPARSRVR